MEIFEAIEQRRAIKHFDPEHKISEEDERQLLSSAILSPTAFNIQHWRLVLVKDGEIRKQIRDVAWGQAQVTEASLLLVLCADMEAWQKEPGRYWKDAPEEPRKILLPAIKQYYEGNEQVKRDEALRSCGIIAQTIMLAAKGLGLDTCPMDGFDFDAVAKIINLPNDHLISMMITVGKAVKPAWPRPGQLPLDEVVVLNKF